MHRFFYSDTALCNDKNSRRQCAAVRRLPSHIPPLRGAWMRVWIRIRDPFHSFIEVFSKRETFTNDELTKMAEITDFGPRKTIFILAIVVGCFAVLWPKIFYPMLTATYNHHPTSDSSGKIPMLYE